MEEGRTDGENWISYRDVPFTDFTEEDEQRGPERIQGIGLVNNGMQFVPDTITRFRNLEMLRIISNPIEFLPDFLFTLQSLRFVVVSECEITCIPDAVVNLHNLFSLAMPRNRIEHVSPCIFYLPGLAFINLDHNRIQGLYLPEDVALDRQVVSLVGNPVQSEDDPSGFLGKKGLRRAFGTNIAFTAEDKERRRRMLRQKTRWYNILRRALDNATCYGIPLRAFLYALLLLTLVPLVSVAFLTYWMKRRPGAGKQQQ